METPSVPLMSVLHLLHTIESFPGSHAVEEWRLEVERVAFAIRDNLPPRKHDLEGTGSFVTRDGEIVRIG